MKTLTKLALGTVVASTGFMVAYAPAQAALLGDTVSAQLSIIGGPTILNQTATVVDPGIEFTILGAANTNLNLDVKSDSFDIIYNLTTLPSVGAPSRWVLSDLDWVDTPGIVTGVTLTSGNASLISGISFTDDSITIDLLDVTTPPSSQTWSFAIQTQHQAVPEPLTILGSVAAMGFGGFFKRKLNNKNKRNVG